MAEDKNAKTQKKPSTSDVKKTADTVYSVSEFAAAADNLFGTVPECVVAAFRCEGITEATKNEAKKIVSAFLKKEV